METIQFKRCTVLDYLYLARNVYSQYGTDASVANFNRELYNVSSLKYHSVSQTTTIFSTIFSADGQTIYLTFRGTSTLTDWIYNLYGQTKINWFDSDGSFADNNMVQQGWLYKFESILPHLEKIFLKSENDNNGYGNTGKCCDNAGNTGNTGNTGNCCGNVDNGSNGGDINCNGKDPCINGNHPYKFLPTSFAKNIVLIGHSAGGVLAMLTAVWLSKKLPIVPHVVTIAMPKFSGSVLAQYIDKTIPNIEIINREDIVAQTKLISDFVEVPDLSLTSRLIININRTHISNYLFPWRYTKYHSVIYYIEEIEQLYRNIKICTHFTV